MKMAVFYMIFFITLVAGSNHTVTGNEISGFQSDGHYHKQKDHGILSKLCP